jgi:protoheme IX farnesyltransferase
MHGMNPSAPSEQSLDMIQDYITLMKPSVMFLVVFTAICGLACAPQHQVLHPFIAILIIVSITLGAGAAGVLNMWYDHDIDAVMERTRHRPIPSGRIHPDEALHFGIFLAGLSVMLLGLTANWLAAALLAFTIFYYIAIYTVWLKRRTPQNIVIGGVAGALPPVIAWAAIAAPLSPLPWLMFLIIFWWTCPHFWALCLCTKEDYARAHLPMLPLSHGVRHTKIQMWAYTLLTVLTAALPWYFGLLGTIYAWGSTLLGLIFLGFMAQAWYSHEKSTYGQLFAYSIVYLFALFALMVADCVLLS